VLNSLPVVEGHGVPSRLREEKRPVVTARARSLPARRVDVQATEEEQYCRVDKAARGGRRWTSEGKLVRRAGFCSARECAPAAPT
jgi:hypothetical protein